MLKRFLIGLLKGVGLGVIVGVCFHFVLGWKVTGGLLGYLIAMGAGATAGIVAGRPPWLHEAWLESLLKGVFGLAVGAAVYWLLVRFTSVGIPFALFGVPEDTPWTSLPLLFAPPIAALFGLIIELDNNPGAGAKKTKTSAKSSRPASPPAAGPTPTS